MNSVYVTVPAFNESETIVATLEKLWTIKDDLEKIGCELFLLVIDDGSTDNTRSLAEPLASKVISHVVNRGLGAAVRTGLTAARDYGADFVIKFDADCQHEPNDILLLLQPLLEEEADVVYGNRFERISYSMPLVRRLGNIVFTYLMKWLTGWDIKDSQPGIFAVNRRYLKVLYLPGDYNYTQQVIFNAYNEGLRFTQRPVAFNKREYGNSFVSYKYPFKVLPQIVQVLIGIKPLKVFGTFGVVAVLLASAVSAFNILQWLLGLTNKPILYTNFVLGVGLFGIQTIFFGFLADMIVKLQQQRRQ